MGDPQVSGSFTVSVVDVDPRELTSSLPVPGRTRWTVYDSATDAFYVNIADPAQIVVIAASDPNRIQRTLDIPVAGPHGLDLDPASSRLFCACDGKALLTLDRRSGEVLDQQSISGVPDSHLLQPGSAPSVCGDRRSRGQDHLLCRAGPQQTGGH